MLTALSIPYADTSAAALLWSPQLPEGAPLDLLRIRYRDPANPAVGDCQVELELQLLGASHCAVLTTGGQQLVETVAGQAYGGQGESLPRHCERVSGSLHYRFESRVQRHSPADLSALAGRLREDAPRRTDRLAGAFPGADDALTVLDGATRPGRARWSTWHLYPNTGEVVRTVTSVSW